MSSHVSLCLDDNKNKTRRWSIKYFTQRKLVHSVVLLAVLFCCTTLFLHLHLSTTQQGHRHSEDLPINFETAHRTILKQAPEKNIIQISKHRDNKSNNVDMLHDIQNIDQENLRKGEEKDTEGKDKNKPIIRKEGIIDVVVAKEELPEKKAIVAVVKEELPEKKAIVVPPPIDPAEKAELGKPLLNDNSIFNHGHLYRVKGEDNKEAVSDVENLKRKNNIRLSMQDVWKRYKKCAWGYDHLHPDTCRGSNWFNFGLTIIDSLDTLFLMGLTEELKEAQNWIRDLDFRKGNNNANLFEMTIRVLGAMVTMATLTRDPLYTSKAQELGDILLVCFNTHSGIPLSDIDFKTGIAHRPTCPGCSSQSSLSEATTLQLEFNELTRLTKDVKYHNATDKSITVILSQVPSDGLMKNYIDVNTGQSSGSITLGARGDSYYEYLLKQWIQTRETRFKDAYMTAMQGIKDHLIFSSLRNLTYVAEYTGTISHKMDHLVCFLPGVLALGTLYECPEWHLTLAEEIIRTCMEMYNTKSGLAPEIIKFRAQNLFIVPNDEFSLLRPETVESLFVLWRITHKPVYRNWAWDIFSSIERSAKNEQGYSSMDRINTMRPSRRDSMESFFLAETLKYLYLIHGPDDVIPLTRYVFNTEAHPIPILPEELQAIIKANIT